MRTDDMPRHDPTKPLSPHPNTRKRGHSQPNKEGKMGLLLHRRQKTGREPDQTKPTVKNQAFFLTNSIIAKIATTDKITL